jgi:pyruvate carboxylase
MIAAVAVELNQTVKKGDRLLVMEAMKMQTTIYAPIDGRVTEKLAHPGQAVEPKELLLVIQ